MRKIILNLAISLDGYICTNDGKFDWIQGDGNKSNDTKKQFDF
ncbi:MAG: dihydrofolate reductase family protein, partial [Candidatus Gracilibacteria bacterium]